MVETDTNADPNLTQRLADDVLASLSGQAVRPVALAVLAAEVERLRVKLAEIDWCSHIMTPAAPYEYKARAEKAEAEVASLKAKNGNLMANLDEADRDHAALRERVGELTALGLSGRKLRLKAEGERDALMGACRAWLDIVDGDKPPWVVDWGWVIGRTKAAVALCERDRERDRDRDRAAETPDAPAAEPTADAPPDPDRITRDDLARQLINERAEARRLDGVLQQVQNLILAFGYLIHEFLPGGNGGPTP